MQLSLSLYSRSIRGESGWSPGELSGLVLDLDQTFVGSPISEWTDELGANDATAAGAVRPALGAIGSLVAADFVPTDDVLSLASTISLTGVFTIAVLVDLDIDSSANYIFGNSTTGSNYCRQRASGRVDLNLGATNKVLTGTSVLLAASGGQTLVITRNSSGDLRTWIDQTEQTAGSVNNTNTLSINQIGSDASTLDGKLGRFWVWTADHSAFIPSIHAGLIDGM